MVRTPVGDRYVLEQMLSRGYNLGGEPSGHIILSDYATTGDGFVAALQVLAVVQKLRRPVSEVCHRFDPLPQILKNVRYRSGKPLDDAEVKSAIVDGEKRLNGHGRLLVRSSGTEPVIRVMGEGDDRILVEEVVDHIVTRARPGRGRCRVIRRGSHRSHRLMMWSRGARVVGHGDCAVTNLFRESPLNKPVIVSEEALAAPVLVPDVAPGLAAKAAAAGPAYVVLAGISFSHFLNDTMQSLIASVYPILKDDYALDFAQIGMITLAFQFTASLLQPVVGHFTDKKAQPFSLAIGMGFTFFGLLLLSVAHRYRDHPDRGVAGRTGFGGVSSGVGADRAARVRRTLRLCAIGVSARRQFRHLDGPGAGGADRGAVRPALDRLVFIDRLSGDRDPVADRRLVQAADRARRNRRRSSAIRIIRIRGASRSRLPCWWRCCSQSSSTCRACRAITSSI